MNILFYFLLCCSVMWSDISAMMLNSKKRKRSEPLMQDESAIKPRKKSKEEYIHQIFYGSKEGNLSLVQESLDNDINVTERDAANDTPLHWAAYKGHTSIVKLLLQKGAHVETRGCQQRTALHEAVHNKKHEIVELLLNKGAPVSVLDGAQEIPLVIAIQKECAPSVRHLLEYGSPADPTVQGDLKKILGLKDTIILHAIFGQTQELKEVLEKQKPSRNYINARDRFGMTALMWASARGYVAIVKVLLNYTVKNKSVTNAHCTNDKGETALILAHKHDKNAVTELLYDYIQPARNGIAQLLSRKNLPKDISTHIASFVYGPRHSKSYFPVPMEDEQ